MKIGKPLLIILIGFAIFCQNSFAASFIHPSPKTKMESSETNYLKASVFSKLSPKQFSMLTGKRLNFFEKLYFKSMQRKLGREVKKNPDLLITEYYDQAKKKFKIDYLWFVLGAIIGPLAILFSFTNKQPKNSRTSALLGCILFVLWFGFIFVF